MTDEVASTGDWSGAAGVAAEDTHAYVELKMDTGEFDYYMYLYVVALVQSSPNATNCVTRAGWGDVGHSEIHTAGERVPLPGIWIVHFGLFLADVRSLGLKVSFKGSLG